MRVASSSLFRLALSDLNNISEDNARLLHEVGTGRRMMKPSDDPSGAVAQLRLRAEAGRLDTTEKNLNNGIDQLHSSELGLNDANSILQRAQELAIESSNGAMSDSQFAAIATEADQLLTELVGIGNRQVDGRYLFAGNKTSTQPFTTTGSPFVTVSYQGDSGTQTVSPAPGITITTNLPGDQAFSLGTAADPYAALISLRDGALAHDVQSLSTTVSSKLSASADAITTGLARIGATSSSLQRTVDTFAQQTITNTSQLSKVEDADMVQAAVDLQNNTARLQAALSAASKVLQPTLFDKMA